MDNEIVEGDGFYISFNPNTSKLGISFKGDNNGCCETALVVPRENKPSESDFFILNGDYRESYAELIPKGLGECLKFFDRMKANHRSSWSNKD